MFTAYWLSLIFYTSHLQTITSYRRTVSSLVSYVFGEPPEPNIIEDILNLEIEINKVTYVTIVSLAVGSVTVCSF